MIWIHLWLAMMNDIWNSPMFYNIGLIPMKITMNPWQTSLKSNVFWAQRFSSTFRGRNAMTNCSWWWTAAKAIKVTSNCLEASTSSSSRRVRKTWWVNWRFLNDGLMGSLYLYIWLVVDLPLWKYESQLGWWNSQFWWVNGFIHGLILMG